MTASDWDEIKRLASDFHRIQLSSSTQKLSERNCIEIVQRLIDLKILEVIFTTDGKEYLTPVELSKEILEELSVAGGRINLVDLQQTLNVDLKHIEVKIAELLRADKNLKIILGQLISKDYFDHICEEINDKLQHQGLITLSELAKNYNLPGDVLKELLRYRLGHLIKGQLDDLGEHIFTEGYLTKQQSVVKGIFTSIIRPTVIFPIITKLGLNERLFYFILDKLLNSGQLYGSVSGGRPYNATYTPDIYVRCQQEWITSFFTQNNYLEYDGLTNFGISDPEGFVKRKFKNENLVFLKSCCIGSDLRDRIEAEMEEALEAGLFFDVTPHLPSFCTAEDSRLITNTLTKKSKLMVIGDRHIIAESFLKEIVGYLKPMVLTKAEKTIKENPSILASHDKLPQLDDDASRDDKKDQRKKKSGTKGLGGPQSREVKTKVVKKKYNAHGSHKENNSDDDDDQGHHNERKIHDSYIFMSIKELSAELAKMPLLVESDQELCDLISIRVAKDLNKLYNEELKNVFLQTANIPPASSNGNVPNKKKLFAEISDKLITLWSSAKLYEKGILHFKEDVQVTLNSYLLKTFCIDIVNLVFSVYAAEAMLTFSNEQSITNEERSKVISAIKDDKTKVLLTKLNSSVNSKNLDEFFLHFDGICSAEFLNINLKRNKNKDRLEFYLIYHEIEQQLMFSHKQSLTKDLSSETNPALILHISSILIFQMVTQSMLHASGKFVPHIISLLKSYLSEDQHTLLLSGQELVIKQLKMTSSNETSDQEKGELDRDLNLVVSQIKDLSLAFRSSADHSTN